MLEAELARIDGKIYKAAEFYELAIQTAGGMDLFGMKL